MTEGVSARGGAWRRFCLAWHDAMGGRMQTKDMKVQDCLDLLRTIRDVTFSTVDGEGLPTARIIDVMGVGEGFITFLTARFG